MHGRTLTRRRAYQSIHGIQVYWLNLNAGYDGDIFLTVILNGAIHTVMYTYYFLSMHTKVRRAVHPH